MNTPTQACLHLRSTPVSIGSPYTLQYLPRFSSVVQRLERANTHNTNAFLLVSLMFSLMILAGVFMSGNGARDTAMALTMFTVLAVGLVTFAVLLVCAHISNYCTTEQSDGKTRAPVAAIQSMQ